MKTNSKLIGLSIVSALLLSACSTDSKETRVAPLVQAVSNDVTVERGPVIGSTVVDAIGQVAFFTGKNAKYTFNDTPRYPITATGGYIDTNNNGIIDLDEKKLDKVLVTYDGDVVTVLTSLSDSFATKLSALGVDIENLKSKTPLESKEAYALSNILYEVSMASGKPIKDLSDTELAEVIDKMNSGVVTYVNKEVVDMNDNDKGVVITSYLKSTSSKTIVDLQEEEVDMLENVNATSIEDINEVKQDIRASFGDQYEEGSEISLTQKIDPTAMYHELETVWNSERDNNQISSAAFLDGLNAFFRSSGDKILAQAGDIESGKTFNFSSEAEAFKVSGGVEILAKNKIFNSVNRAFRLYNFDPIDLDYGLVEEELNNSEATQANLESDLSDALTTKSEIETQLTEITELKDSLEAQLGTLADDLNVSGLESQIDAANLEIDTLNESLISAESNVTSLSEEVDLLKLDKGSLETQLADSVTALETEIANSETAQADLQSQIDTVTAAKTTIENDLATANDSLSTLQADLTTANESVVSLQAQIDTLSTDQTAEIASLNTQLDAAIATQTDLQTQVNTVNTEKTALETSLATANTQITSLTIDLTTAQESVTTLTTQLATANTNLTTVQSNLDLANADLVTIQNDLDTANTTITDLQAQVASNNTVALNAYISVSSNIKNALSVYDTTADKSESTQDFDKAYNSYTFIVNTLYLFMDPTKVSAATMEAEIQTLMESTSDRNKLALRSSFVDPVVTALTDYGIAVSPTFVESYYTSVTDQISESADINYIKDGIDLANAATISQITDTAEVGAILAYEDYVKNLLDIKYVNLKFTFQEVITATTDLVSSLSVSSQQIIFADYLPVVKARFDIKIPNKFPDLSTFNYAALKGDIETLKATYIASASLAIHEEAAVGKFIADFYKLLEDQMNGLLVIDFADQEQMYFDLVSIIDINKIDGLQFDFLDPFELLLTNNGISRHNANVVDLKSALVELKTPVLMEEMGSEYMTFVGAKYSNVDLTAMATVMTNNKLELIKFGITHETVTYTSGVSFDFVATSDTVANGYFNIAKAEGSEIDMLGRTCNEEKGKADLYSAAYSKISLVQQTFRDKIISYKNSATARVNTLNDMLIAGGNKGCL